MAQGGSMSVLLSLTRDAYKPGDTVCGSVSFDGEACAVSRSEDLLIQVTGTETTHIKTGGRRGDHQFFKYVAPLEVHEDSKILQPGSTVITPQSRSCSAAFGIALPLHLPPTFAASERAFDATISYEVSVMLRSSGSVLATTCMRVLSAPGPHIGPPSTGGSIERFAEQDMSECYWCCGYLFGCRTPVWGRVGVYLGAESENMCIGGRLRAYATVQKDSRAPVECRMKLVRHVCAKSEMVPGAISSRPQTFTVWEDKESVIRSTKQQKHLMSRDVFIPLDADMPSVAGKLIQCRYELQCTVQPQRGVCATRVEATLPLQILAVDHAFLHHMHATGADTSQEAWSNAMYGKPGMGFSGAYTEYAESAPPSTLAQAAQALGLPAVGPPLPMGTMHAAGISHAALEQQPLLAPPLQAMSD